MLGTAKVPECSKSGMDVPVADAILRLPRDMGTVYIVMGAYGRGRVMEALLGGAQLRQSETPLLLAHYGSSVRQ